jgi:hypothetical protein
VIRLLALGMLLILPATSGAQQRPPILEKITKTYGLELFGQIEAIRYTFNAEAPGLNVSRSQQLPFPFKRNGGCIATEPRVQLSTIAAAE